MRYQSAFTIVRLLEFAAYANEVVSWRQAFRDGRRPLERVDNDTVAPFTVADSAREQAGLVDLEPLEVGAVHRGAVAAAVGEIDHDGALAVRPLVPLGGDLGTGGDGRGLLACAGSAVVVAVDGLRNSLSDLQDFRITSYSRRRSRP